MADDPQTGASGDTPIPPHIPVDQIPRAPESIVAPQPQVSQPEPIAEAVSMPQPEVAAPEVVPAPVETSVAEVPPHAGVPTDIGSILLPKKETGPSPLSATRVNAAAVLEAATMPLQPEAPAPAPITPQEPVKSTEDITALRTYKSDVEETVRGKNISMVSIAAAQAGRTSTAPLLDQKEKSRINLRKIGEIGGGMVLLAGTIGIIAVALLHKPAPSTAPQQSSYFVYLDETDTVPITSQETRGETVLALDNERQSVHLSVGLIARIEPTWQSTGAPLTAQEFFSKVASGASGELARSLSSDFLLGVHSFDANQSFLMFKTDSYAQAYAGMLQWENTMQNDLSPLFTRTPAPRIPQNSASESITATQLLQTPFADRIVENHDARVLQNQSGDILLLWTFLDRNTLVITTNEYTLREVIARLSEAPVVSAPGK